MSIQGLGSNLYFPQTKNESPIGQIAGQNNSPPANNSLDTGQKVSTADEFLNYMQKSPLQRMQEAWLQAHKISAEELAAMSPEDREKILNQMQKDIEESIRKNADNDAPKNLDLVV